MINKIEIENFKCFRLLNLKLLNLTLLAGANASGKSSLLQALVVLHQTIRQNQWGNRLILNGETLSLGTVQDVVSKTHGRNDFKIALTQGESRYCWSFSGSRDEMSMDIDYQSADKSEKAPLLNKLIPSRIKTEVKIRDTLENLTYIKAERIGPRDYYPLKDASAIQTVGSNGEYAVSCIYRLAEKEVPQSLYMQSEPRILIKQVGAWMQCFFPGCAIDVAPIAHMNAVSLGIKNSEETSFHRPINVGFGLTQILPILVSVLSADPGDLILIENPEVHLHPAGQALMGSFLAMAANSGIQIILETHSDHVLNGIRRAVRKKLLDKSQVAMHFFRPLTTDFDQVVSPQLDSSGNIDCWPAGFFDQFDKDMSHFAGWGD